VWESEYRPTRALFLLLYPEDRGSQYLRNFRNDLLDYTASHSKVKGVFLDELFHFPALIQANRIAEKDNAFTYLRKEGQRETDSSKVG
jgi:hypothetical protein